jgi:hypothetical protein
MRRRELPERACTDTRRRPTCSSHGVGETKTGCLKTGQARPKRPRAAGNRHSDCRPQRLRVRPVHATPAWRGQTRPKRGGSRGAASLPSVGKQVCAHMQSNGRQDSAQWTSFSYGDSRRDLWTPLNGPYGAYAYTQLIGVEAVPRALLVARRMHNEDSESNAGKDPARCCVLVPRSAGRRLCVDRAQGACRGVASVWIAPSVSSHAHLHARPPRSPPAERGRSRPWTGSTQLAINISGLVHAVSSLRKLWIRAHNTRR